MADKNKDNPTGPVPERLKLDEDWEDAVDRALAKPRPDEGWPKDEAEDADEGTEKDPSDREG